MQSKSFKEFKIKQARQIQKNCKPFIKKPKGGIMNDNNVDSKAVLQALFEKYKSGASEGGIGNVIMNAALNTGDCVIATLRKAGLRIAQEHKQRVLQVFRCVS